MLYEQPSGKGEVPVDEQTNEWKDGWMNGKTDGIDKEWRKGRMDGKQQVKKDYPHVLVHTQDNTIHDVYLFQV